MGQNEDLVFDREYFTQRCGPVPLERGTGTWEAAWAAAGQGLVSSLQPRRVLDVGCGMGFLVEQLRSLGVEAYGTEVSEYALSSLPEPLRPYVRYENALDAPEEEEGERFDVVTCIGVAEHLPERDAPVLVNNLCQQADEVMFSAGGGDHANPFALHVRGEAYWNDLFAKHDFFPVRRDGPSYFPAAVTHYRKVSRKVKVAVFTRERPDWAVVRLRLLDPLRHLEQNGRIELTVVTREDAALPIETLMETDIWVIHREFADQDYSEGLIEAARLLDKVVVFEIDDLITHLPSSHPMREYCDKVSGDVLSAAREADFVTGTTETLLAAFASQEPSIAGKAFALRNVVNAELWGTKRRVFTVRPEDPFVVGWIGSLMHDDDLALVRDTILYLRRKHDRGIEFHFYGYLPPALKDLPGVQLIRIATADYSKYVKNVRESYMNVGMAPLVDNDFNRGKSDIKWLEYSIAGIPGIYSDVAPYASTVRDEVNGLLVENTTEAWVAAIERMMDDEELRDRIAKRAHRDVLERLTVQQTASRWDDLYRSFLATGPTLSSLARLDLDAEAAGSRAAALMLLMQARHQLRASNEEGVAQSLDVALEMDPTLVDTIVSVAAEQTDAGRVALAERLLTSVVAKAPDCPDAVLALARLRNDEGDSLGAARALVATEDHHLLHAHVAAEQMNLMRKHGDEAGLTRRLRQLLEREFSADEVVGFAELCLAYRRPAVALELVDRASEVFKDADFEPLQRALARAAESPVATPATGVEPDLRVAVYTTDPLFGHRFEQRMAAPLRSLEASGVVTWKVSDGTIRADIAGDADLVIIHGAYGWPSRSGSPLRETIRRARAGGAKVIFDLDELPFERLAMDGDRGALDVRDEIAQLVREVDAVTVVSAGIAGVLTDLEPAAADKIHVLPTFIDPRSWSTGLAWSPPERRPFEIGIFVDYARSSEIADLVRALGPVLSKSDAEVSLTTWSSRHEYGAPLRNDAVIGSATPFHREYAANLIERRLHLALVPVSNDLYHTTLTDNVFNELAISAVPGIFTARDPFRGTIENGKNGLLLGDRFSDWSNIVTSVMGCPELLRSIADCAWNQVFAARTSQAQAGRWEELLRGMTHVESSERMANAAVGRPATVS